MYVSNMDFKEVVMRILIWLSFVLLTGCGGLEIIAGSYTVGLAGYSVVDAVSLDDQTNE